MCIEGSFRLYFRFRWSLFHFKRNLCLNCDVRVRFVLFMCDIPLKEHATEAAAALLALKPTNPHFDGGLTTLNP